MPRTSTAARIAVVHPASESRIERASTELMQIRKDLAELNARKDELSARILTMVKHEGETVVDSKGVEKIRYETDAHKFVVIAGKNTYIGEGKLRAAMTSFGMTPKEIERVLVKSGARQVTEYEYVGVYDRKEDEK